MTVTVTSRITQAKNLVVDEKPWVKAFDVILGRTEAIRLTSHDKSFVWNGYTYLPWPIQVDEQQQDTSGNLRGLQVTAGNVTRSLSIELKKRVGLTDNDMTVHEIYDPDGTPERVISNTFAIKTASADADEHAVTFDLGRDAILDAEFPRNHFWRNICRFSYNFKGLGQCASNGPQATCDRGLITPNGCAEHDDNNDRWGGFWGMPIR